MSFTVPISNATGLGDLDLDTLVVHLDQYHQSDRIDYSNDLNTTLRGKGPLAQFLLYLSGVASRKWSGFRNWSSNYSQHYNAKLNPTQSWLLYGGSNNPSTMHQQYTVSNMLMILVTASRRRGPLTKTDYMGTAGNGVSSTAGGYTGS